MTWLKDQWHGDPIPLAREIRAQMVRHGENLSAVGRVIGNRHQASVYRRLNGQTRWRHWEMQALADHWGIKIADLTGESAEIQENNSAVP